MEFERSKSQKVDESDDHKIENRSNVKKIKKKRNIISSKLGCFRRDDYGISTVEEVDVDGNLDMESASNFGAGRVSDPTHLVVTVNGIIGSAQNWRYAAKQFLKRYPHDVIVHCSKSNYSMLTFDGVDVMGSRLADEVLSVVKRYPGLRKISFIGHSLGGLITRYAIALLYSQEFTEESRESPCSKEKFKGKIAGLEPMNFITSASPHLGCRGHRQVPMFCGILAMEKAASRISWLMGRTGKHLFLTDADDGKPPLVLQMSNDSEDLKFISALQSFKRRVAYANARFDHIVGWSTSSIRHRNELPKHKNFPRNNRYPHVVNEETTRTDNSCKAQVSGYKSDAMEETMIKGLTKVSWERVDVSFKGSRQRFLAHSTIQLHYLFLLSKMVYILRCHSNGKFIIFFIFFSLSSLAHLIFMAQGRVMHNHIDLTQKIDIRQTDVLVTRNLIGSRPPRCEKKCTNCGYCKAVQVPIAPLQKKSELEKNTHNLYAAAYYSRGDDISNYKPMCWKCKCGDSFYNP